MSKVLVTLRLDPRKATVAHVVRAFRLAASDIDAEYGVVNISPDDHLYVAMIEERAAARLQGVPGVRGPFSNPRIEPFGTPEP